MDLEETYAYVCRDSVHRAALNGEPEHSEPSAMVARPFKFQQRQTNPKPDRTSSPLNHDHNQSFGSQNHSYEIGAARPERMCTHCGETGHTKSWFYELIGYPEWWDFAKAPLLLLWFILVMLPPAILRKPPLSLLLLGMWVRLFIILLLLVIVNG